MATLHEQKQMTLNISGSFQDSNLEYAANLKYESSAIHNGHEWIHILPWDNNTVWVYSNEAEYLWIKLVTLDVHQSWGMIQKPANDFKFWYDNAARVKPNKAY